MIQFFTGQQIGPSLEKLGGQACRNGIRDGMIEQRHGGNGIGVASQEGTQGIIALCHQPLVNGYGPRGNGFLNLGLVKVELGLGRGKKIHDKRDAKAKKDVQRRIDKEMGRR